MIRNSRNLQYVQATKEPLKQRLNKTFKPTKENQISKETCELINAKVVNFIQLMVESDEEPFWSC